jgi:CSLREA domain-containing protein
MYGTMKRGPWFGIAVSLGLCWGGVAGAAEIVVNTKADVIAQDGKCSLREALRAAETNKKVGGCAAGSPAGIDSIQIPAGTYDLTQGPLFLGPKVRLNGVSKNTVIIDGRIITDFQPEQSAWIKHVTLLHGCADHIGGPSGDCGTDAFENFELSNGLVASYQAGGCLVHLLGTLTLDHVVVRACGATSGGGIRNDGTLHLVKVALRDNDGEGAGGIFNNGALTMTDSYCDNNNGDEAGGCAINNGFMRVTNSQITNNSSGSDQPGTGAIHNSVGATFTMTGGMCKGNISQFGGCLFNAGSATLAGVSVTGNQAWNTDTPVDGGGGVFNMGELVLTKGTKVCDNTAFDDETDPIIARPSDVIDWTGSNAHGETTIDATSKVCVMGRETGEDFWR